MAIEYFLNGCKHQEAAKTVVGFDRCKSLEDDSIEVCRHQSVSFGLCFSMALLIAMKYVTNKFTCRYQGASGFIMII